jgi:hypothetical protein
MSASSGPRRSTVSYITVNYVCDRHKYAATGRAAPSTGGRPWADVLFSLGGRAWREWCLVDTGADDSMLDVGAASGLGVDMSYPPGYHVTNSSGGSTAYYRRPLVGVTFAGLASAVTVPVLFGPVSVPILGRSALTAASAPELGFTDVTWQHT